MSSRSRVDMLALTDARERAGQCGIPDAMTELSVSGSRFISPL